MSAGDFAVRVVDWSEAMPLLRAVREEVFVGEQKVPLELEWDEWDARCLHVLAVDARGNAIGTGRLLPDGHIGRMAVLKSWRGKGVGAAILELLLDCARQRGFRTAHLNSQTHAAGFYEKFGFRPEGEEFMEAGIPHVAMSRVL